MAKKKKEDDWKSWALIVFFFIIGVWPIALILLFLMLLWLVPAIVFAVGMTK